jgi:allantoicase
MNESSPTLNQRIGFTELVDLAGEKVGGVALATSDDFFAPKENLLKTAPAIFIADKFTEFGKWMDGWESRRKRNLVPESHDWCIVRLGLPGVIHGVNVDTSFFVGNYPEYCALDGLVAEAGATAEALGKGPWTEIVPKARLTGGVSNLFAVSSRERFTHVRLRIFPDGGVARLRVHGEVRPDFTKLKGAASIDLAALENGGVVVACNDNFFGPKDNLIMPGRAKTMGEGWETRRKRGPGHDWIIVNLGRTGRVTKLEIDTNHFKGNFPESCSVEGALVSGERLLAVDFRDRTDIKWQELLPRTKLQAHHQHHFEKELRTEAAAQKFNYIRLNIFPDGGISRLRVFGVQD